ncbi:4-aminobutyrate--2-oxoglutarate transaminase [Candidatus Bathyarchaeota archaeon]|nr:MAG: 4-aminobutyrate--2-oxoglutarate transaminase [Candidatus Bathyarchaeota archaeon]
MSEAPKIVTLPPGPKSRRLLEERERYVPPGVYLIAPIALERAEGAVVEDVDGNRYIDFTSGIGVTSLGHTRREIVEVIKEQAERLIHTCIHVTNYRPYLDLAKELTEITPGRFPKRAILLNSGAEAVENAVKIVRQYSKRPGIISFENSFHGRTYMALTLTGKWDPYKVGFAPFVPGVYMAPYAYCYRCPFHLNYPDCGLACVEYIEKSLLKTQVPPQEVGGLIAEPIQGEGGFIAPPPDYFKALKALCDDHGILLIIDEVQTGFGRTGRWFAIEHWGVEPDVMTMGKAIAAGLPLSAVVARDELMRDVYPGSLGGTYGGNPLACVAALKVIEIIKRDGIVERAARLGEKISKRLGEMGERYEIIGDIRGKGPMMAMELVKDRGTKEPAVEETKEVLKTALNRGLLLLKAGLYGNVVRLHPPLTIEDELLEKGLDLLEETIRSVSQ